MPRFQYEYGAECDAIVTSRSRTGAYVLLDSGERAFVPHLANLKAGSFIRVSLYSKNKVNKNGCRIAIYCCTLEDVQDAAA